ncbi:MAG: hypothetical protein V2A69_10595 [Pseudomonadota bacterium]
MPSIHFPSEYDRLKAFDRWKPVVMDLEQRDLQVVVLLLLNGADLDYAFDIAMSRA